MRTRTAGHGAVTAAAHLVLTPSDHLHDSRVNFGVNKNVFFLVCCFLDDRFFDTTVHSITIQVCGGAKDEVDRTTHGYLSSR